MKKILLLLSLVAFAVGCNQNETPTPKPPTSKYQKHAGNNEIKVMSFNVRTSASPADKDTPNQWDNRKAACLALIKDQMPDIMGTQETTYTDQWVWLKTQLKSAGYDGYGINRITGKESGSGEVSGILYNTNVVRKKEAGTFWLSETPDTPTKGWDAENYRTAAWGLFEHIPTGKEFFFVNTHLDHKSTTAQVEGMKLIANKLKEYKGECPLLLTGDFNVGSTDEAMKAVGDFMYNARLYANRTDSHGTTNGFSNPNAKSQIDHIYYSRELKRPTEYYTIREAYNGVTYVSDHYPIYAIIKLK